MQDPPSPSATESLLTRSRQLSQRVATFHQRIGNEGDTLAEEVKQLQADIARDLKRTNDEAAEREVLRAKDCLQGHGPGGDLRKLLKQQLPALLRFLLGPRTNVVATQRNESIRLKEEYHAFRDRSGVYLFIFAAALLFGLRRADLVQGKGEPYSFTPPFMVGVQLFLCWLLYSYTALALRESILKVNGSNIRPWWIHHHYWSIGTCMLILTLPVDSQAYQEFLKSFLWWSCYQGLVMMMQNRYQRRRMYTRIALGKNRAMDVVSGESSGSSGQLVIIYPMLMGLQALQAGIGVQMVRRTGLSFLSPEGWLDFESHESDLRGSRGVAIIGLLMQYMAFCNFHNTVITLWNKAKQPKRAQGQSAHRDSGASLAPEAQADEQASTPDKQDIDRLQQEHNNASQKQEPRPDKT